MAPSVIAVERIGKRYAVGGRPRPSTLRESLSGIPAALLSRRSARRDASEFWALRDISFEVREGEAVAVIGRNGAGKSTLLKLLSRITMPTEGRARIAGRVGSLLEVGTGFHSELTGRENVFLNGAILGMHRSEIRRRFDAIVEYADVDRFIDTPVKHYSSGMYMRLAFSVAAHLEPDILIIDEVLAVGDAAFQKKCLGKMSDVARSGRTVLFVSHNMSAVRALCTRGIVLEQGRVFQDSEVVEAVQAYQRSLGGRRGVVWERVQASDKSLIIDSVETELLGTQPRHRLAVTVELKTQSPHATAHVAIDILDPLGAAIMQAIPTISGFIRADSPRHRVELEIDLPPLVPGEYGVSVWVGSHNTETLDWARSCVTFEITQTPTEGRTFPHSSDHGHVVPESRVRYTPLRS